MRPFGLSKVITSGEGGTLIQRSRNRRKSDRIRVAENPDRILCTICVYHFFRRRKRSRTLNRLTIRDHLQRSPLAACPLAHGFTLAEANNQTMRSNGRFRIRLSWLGRMARDERAPFNSYSIPQ